VYKDFLAWRQVAHIDGEELRLVHLLFQQIGSVTLSIGGECASERKIERASGWVSNLSDGIVIGVFSLLLFLTGTGQFSSIDFASEIRDGVLLAHRKLVTVE